MPCEAGGIGTIVPVLIKTKAGNEQQSMVQNMFIDWITLQTIK